MTTPTSDQRPATSDQQVLQREVADCLDEHVHECDDCRGAAPPVAEIAAKLGSASVAVDASALSARVMKRLAPEMARRRQALSLWSRPSMAAVERRRAALGMVAAFVPLAAVVVLDAFVLRALYAWASPLLPAGVAAYFVVSYAATLALLFGATYAAIPLALAQRRWLSEMTTAEVMS